MNLRRPVGDGRKVPKSATFVAVVQGRGVCGGVTRRCGLAREGSAEVPSCRRIGAETSKGDAGGGLRRASTAERKEESWGPRDRRSSGGLIVRQGFWGGSRLGLGPGGRLPGRGGAEALVKGKAVSIGAEGEDKSPTVQWHGPRLAYMDMGCRGINGRRRR